MFIHWFNQLPLQIQNQISLNELCQTQGDSSAGYCHILYLYHKIKNKIKLINDI
jgi:hypothetical protein